VAFQNHIRSTRTPSWIKDAWSSLKSKPQNDPERREFVREVARRVDKQFEASEFLSNFKLTQSRQDTESSGSQGAWISYDALVKKDRHKFQLDF